VIIHDMATESYMVICGNYAETLFICQNSSNKTTSCFTCTMSLFSLAKHINFYEKTCHNANVL